MNLNSMVSLARASLFANIACLATFICTSANATPLDQIASPVSNPVNFEDPRIESNVKPLFAYHKIDRDFITDGGDVRIYA